MTDDSETDKTDEQLKEYQDREDVSMLIDGDGSWEARIEGGEVIDTGEVNNE